MLLICAGTDKDDADASSEYLSAFEGTYQPPLPRLVEVPYKTAVAEPA